MIIRFIALTVTKISTTIPETGFCIAFNSQVKGFDKIFIQEIVDQLKSSKKAQKELSWIEKYATVNHRSLDGEAGFILENGIFERFEPVGITWNDFYCRRITDDGPSGCFVERDLSIIPDFNYHENNCTG